MNTSSSEGGDEAASVPLPTANLHFTLLPLVAPPPIAMAQNMPEDGGGATVAAAPNVRFMRGQRAPPATQSLASPRSPAGTTNACLAKCTVSQLRVLAAHHGVKLRSGLKKRGVVSRLEVFFEQTRAALTVQSIFRGYVVRAWLDCWRCYHYTSPPHQASSGGGDRWRLPGEIHNTTDFYSLERIVDMPPVCVFCFTDEMGFRYAFHVMSLMKLLHASANLQTLIQIKNPYNRKLVSTDVTQTMLEFCFRGRITLPLLSRAPPDDADASEQQMLSRQLLANSRSRRFHQTRVQRFVTAGSQTLPRVGNRRPRSSSSGSMESTSSSASASASASAAAVPNLALEFLRTKRATPIHQRIVSLFIEIDMLGNYTQIEWFTSLSLAQTVQYWGSLYDIWLYRARILDETKHNVCPIHDPFFNKHLLRDFQRDHGLSSNSQIMQLQGDNMTTAIQEYCLYAMENMVFMSDNNEYRSLGAQYVLMALTLVQPNARMAIPWLYESIMF